MKKPRLPGFTAEACFYQTKEPYYLLRNGHSLSTQLILTPAFDGCPGCDRFCIPCDECLRSASNPRRCSFICNKCWACDCFIPPDDIA